MLKLVNQFRKKVKRHKRNAVGHVDSKSPQDTNLCAVSL